MTEKAFAKLNISLDVGEARPDGYHEMTMVMQTVSLCDELELSLNGGKTVTAETNLSYIPGDRRNLAVAAALKYLDEIGQAGQGIHIKIKKRIPVGAGMGGGSADAAAVLRAMERLMKGGLGAERLERLACAIGSDVPFCVRGGTALARGRGELLEPLPPLPDCCFAVCKPTFSISTPELFKKLDREKLRHHPDTQGIIDALGEGSLERVCRRMYNVFENVDDRRMRTVADIKSILLDCGALGAIMTGTGSAVYGVFTNDAQAAAACARLRPEYRFAAVARPEPRVL